MEQSRKLICILWPSFLVACAAEAAFFTVFHPADLHPFGGPSAAGERLAYTIGFFAFWLFAASASALTCFLQSSAAQVNAPRVIPDGPARLR
jgi:hypothetical protein